MRRVKCPALLRACLLSFLHAHDAQTRASGAEVRRSQKTGDHMGARFPAGTWDLGPVATQTVREPQGAARNC